MNRPKVISTKGYASNGVKMVVHGTAGVGKTCLCATLESPIILSVESGLLSLSALDIPAVEISTFEQLVEVYNWITESDESKSYRSICLDSLSEIAEVVLANEKDKERDPRKAYLNVQDMMCDIIRNFRDISGKDIYMSAKQERIQDENGRLLYCPSMPGQKLAQNIPYLFDEVFALRIMKDKDGNPYRVLQTQPDGSYLAKDRSGILDPFEEPDLGKIIEKIRSM